MPLYSYMCDVCGVVKEFTLAIVDRDYMVGRDCLQQSCRGTLKRIVDGGNFQLKGNGWSRDNYATVFGDTPGFNKGSDR